MTMKMILICAGGLVLVSCNPGKEISSNDEASGIYIREYAIEITNPNTEEKIGMRQIRDSIFVSLTDNGYQVSNRKWKMNDYDQDGWVSMAHADDRPLPTFLASYDERSEQLNPENSNISQPLFVDSKSGILFKNSSKDIGYKRVK